MHTSIKSKILTFQILFILFVSVLLGFSTYLFMINTLKKNQKKILQFIAQDQSDHLSGIIEDKKRIFEKIVMGEAVEEYSQEYNESMLMKYFNKFIEEIPILSYINEHGLEELKSVNGNPSKSLSR